MRDDHQKVLIFFECSKAMAYAKVMLKRGLGL